MRKRKSITPIVVLITLLVGIVVAVYFSKEIQIFNSKAFQGPEAYICKFGPAEIKYGENGEMDCALNPFTGEKGYATGEVRCEDGFTQKLPKQAGICMTKEGVQYLAEMACENHSSCPNLNINPDPQSRIWVGKIKSASAGIDKYAEVTFSVVAKDGLDALHTAVWPDATSEEKAKSNGRQGLYQGFGTTYATRFVTVPSYIEYLSYDKKEHRENVNKRVITENPRSIFVSRKVIGNFPQKDLIAYIDDSLPDFESTLLDSGRQQESAFSEFRYLLPGSHILRYFVPRGYVATVEMCEGATFDNCSATEINDNGKPFEIETYQTLNVNLAQPEGSKTNIKMTFKAVDKSYPNPPSTGATPANLTARCDESRLTLRWDQDSKADSYLIRGGKGLTSRPDDATWENLSDADRIRFDAADACSNGNCTYNTDTTLTGRTIRAGESYYLWVHSKYSSGAQPPATVGPVTCAQGTYTAPRR